MTCSECGRTNERGALFCSYCGERVVVQQAQARPVTGPTVRLDQTTARVYATPTPVSVASAAPSPVQPARRRSKDVSGQVFMIGLIVLFFTGYWWPGILLLLGVSGFVRETAKGRSQKALEQLVFFGGITLIAFTNWWWPGVLLVLLASSFVGGKWQRGWC